MGVIDQREPLAALRRFEVLRQLGLLRFAQKRQIRLAKDCLALHQPVQLLLARGALRNALIEIGELRVRDRQLPLELLDCALRSGRSMRIRTLGGHLCFERLHLPPQSANVGMHFGLLRCELVSELRAHDR